MRNAGVRLREYWRATRALVAGKARLYLVPVIRGGDDNGGDPPADPPADPKPSDPSETFTKSDVDRLVRERTARERQKFGDYDDLKAKAAELDKIREGEQSELEKAQARAEAAEQREKEAAQRARETSLRASVIAEAAKRNVVDPDAAYALLDRAALEADDDGNPTNLEDVFDVLLESKPYLVGQKGGSSADQGARGGSAKGQISRDALVSMSPEQIVEAQKEGRLNDLLGVKQGG